MTSGDDLAALRNAGLWRDGEPLRLHLGCGEQILAGYVNIDYPQDNHNVMAVRADYSADITQLAFPANSVDEIRLHHVFEHFGRVAALALLIRWQEWLRPGGRLHIETPDLLGSACTLTAEASLPTKMGVARHLAGDQAAAWAYHRDHWFPDRYQHTLEQLGFAAIQIESRSWPHEPFLSNVQVLAQKGPSIAREELLDAADSLLWESTVAPSETPTWNVWRAQLRDALQPRPAGASPAFGAETLPRLPSAAVSSARSLDDIYNANQRQRDAWVQAKAAAVPAGSRVLDVGAGTCPYRALFAHCAYHTHDFGKYEGKKLGGVTEYGTIDFVSDIKSIPAPDRAFDVILCTEVLEHVPEPIAALREMSRLLKPNGLLLLSAPLGSGLHQLPYHFYGGFTPEWYRHFGRECGLQIRAVTPNGGFFQLLAQECARVAWTMDQHRHLHAGQDAPIQALFGEWLPRYLSGLEERLTLDQFTTGYFVEAVKGADFNSLQAQIDQDPMNVELYHAAAWSLLGLRQAPSARRYFEDACELDYSHAELTPLREALCAQEN